MKFLRMMSKLVSAVYLLTVLAGGLRAADGFEGRVFMKMVEGKKKQSMEMNYATKGAKLRMEMPQGKKEGMAAMLMDLNKKEMYMLMEMDGQKMYMRHRIDDAAAVAAGKAAKMPEPVATGRTETIAGYSADEYKWTDDDGNDVELWLGKGLGYFMSAPAMGPMGGKQSSPAWEKIVRDRGFFPLRVVTKNKKGEERSRMEVTKIEKTSLPDSLFSLDGYSEFKMPGFGG